MSGEPRIIPVGQELPAMVPPDNYDPRAVEPDREATKKSPDHANSRGRWRTLNNFVSYPKTMPYGQPRASSFVITTNIIILA